MAAQDSTLRTLATDRVFRAGLAVLLLLVALYTAAVVSAWSKTPLGLYPQGESRAWLASAESLHAGEMAREPFFRSPAYIALLSLSRDVGVTQRGLSGAARVLNSLAHVLATALVAMMARRLWNRASAGLLAGALWGFYPPAVFMVVQPGPNSIAVLLWLVGAAAALATKWRAPEGLDDVPSQRHLWAYPFAAGVAFVVAAALNANLWPTALGWPFLVLLLGRESRGVRLVGASAGVVGVIVLLATLQNIWGGSPQPLPGADLYRFSRALEITQPWAAPRPVLEFREDMVGPDVLEAEAVVSYPSASETYIPPRAVMDGYWWRRGMLEIRRWPGRSLLRAARKFVQFFHYQDNGTGPAYSRARGEITALRLNPLGWTLVLVAGGLGLAVGSRKPGAWVALALAALAGAGAVVWYPTMEARAPVVAMLAVYAGALLAQPWPRGWRRWLGLPLLAIGLVVFALLPRKDDPAAQLLAQDSLRRAQALAELGKYDNALAELGQGVNNFSDTEKELCAEWKFAHLLNDLPAMPSQRELEAQLLDNGELTSQSRAAQFRSGAYLWLLGRQEGALFFWRGLTEGQDEWGTVARTAIAASGMETPDEAQLRAAWEISGGSKPNPALTPFLDHLRQHPASAGK